jgi:hypothetical protein
MEELLYEVETRFSFPDREAAFAALPLLRPVLQGSSRWRTVHYGLALFRKDEILRIGFVDRGAGEQIFLGWKGPDRGNFANIRLELDEEIGAGTAHSQVLARIGGDGRFPGTAGLQAELERLGHAAFMSFTGENLTGFSAALGIHFKLMHCPLLKHPWLLEAEKNAATPGEALRLEQELSQFADQYSLAGLRVRAEPPTLLFQTI